MKFRSSAGIGASAAEPDEGVAVTIGALGSAGVSLKAAGLCVGANATGAAAGTDGILTFSALLACL